MGFQKGNKLGGRKSTDGFDIQRASALLVPRCLKRLEKMLDGDDDRAALGAIKELFDRAFGKAKQDIKLDGSATFNVIIETKIA